MATFVPLFFQEREAIIIQSLASSFAVALVHFFSLSAPLNCVPSSYPQRTRRPRHSLTHPVAQSVQRAAVFPARGISPSLIPVSVGRRGSPDPQIVPEAEAARIPRIRSYLLRRLPARYYHADGARGARGGGTKTICAFSFFHFFIFVQCSARRRPRRETAKRLALTLRRLYGGRGAAAAAAEDDGHSRRAGRGRV